MRLTGKRGWPCTGAAMAACALTGPPCKSAACDERGGDRFGRKRAASGGVELRNIAELGPAAQKHFVQRKSLELVQVPEELFIEHRRGTGRVGVRASRRLGNNVVDAAN